MKDWRNSPIEPYSDMANGTGEDGVIRSVGGNVAVGIIFALIGIGVLFMPLVAVAENGPAILLLGLLAVLPFGGAAWLWLIAYRKSVWRSLHPRGNTPLGG